MPVDDAAPGDDGATTQDSAAFTCPSTYDVTIDSTTSHYRLISTNATFWTHRTACNEMASTHVAVLETIAEAAELKAIAGQAPQPSNGRFYVGAIQDPTSTTVGGGWIWLNGDAVAPALWGVFTGLAQPDDGVDGVEGNHDEQLAALDPTVNYLIDVRGMTGYGAICECDGVAEDATAVARIDADPNNPN